MNAVQQEPEAVRIEATQRVFRVCGPCRVDLVALGAAVVPGPHVIEFGTRCEVHGKIGSLAAASVIALSPALEAKWFEAKSGEALAPFGEDDDPADAPLVAKLACSLIVAQAHEPTDDTIYVSVMLARRVLAAARGK